MKLLIVGGTGGTGKELIKQALEQGHQLTVLARNPGKVNMTHPALSLVKGDVLDPVSVQQVVAGQDAVLSALGHKKFIVNTTILSAGTKNIIDAMQNEHVSRFICITSLGINESRFKLGLYYTIFVIPVIVFFYFRDKSKQEKLIRDSKLGWTIIRPGQLTYGKKRGIYKHGPGVGNYIFTKMISRADVAHFMLSQLNNATYLRKATGITY